MIAASAAAVDLGDEVVGALRLHLQAAGVERGAIDDRAGAPARRARRC